MHNLLQWYVYVINLGDNSVVLAQDRPNDQHPNPNLKMDDVSHRNKFKQSLVRMELDNHIRGVSGASSEWSS